MDEQRVRAVLVGCCALVFLLAAALMPAAGLGTFPGGEPVEDSSGGNTTAETATPEPTTEEETTTTTESTTTATETTTEAIETTTETETSAPEPDDNGDEDPGVGLLVFGSLVSVAVFLGAAGLALTGGYVGVVAVGGYVFGFDAVSGLPFSASIRSIPQYTMASLLTVTASTASIVDRLGDLAGVFRTSFAVDFGVAAAVLTAPLRAFSALGRIGSLGNIFGGVSLGSLTGGEASVPPGEDPRATAATSDEETTAARPDSIQGAFRWLLSAAPVSDSESATPGEVARAAVDAGYPSGPVERLVATFRKIRYGGYEETSELTAEAQRALDRLRGAIGGDDD